MRRVVESGEIFSSGSGRRKKILLPLEIFRFFVGKAGEPVVKEIVG
jgi:hypothetical protein